MIALQFRRVHSVEVVGPRSLNSTPLRSMWSRQEQINAPYTLPRQRESGRNRPYGCSMPPTSRPHFRVGSMIHRTVFGYAGYWARPRSCTGEDAGLDASQDTQGRSGSEGQVGRAPTPSTTEQRSTTRRSTRARERWRCRCGAIPTIESTSTPVTRVIYALLNFIRGSQFPSGAEAKTVTVEIPRFPGLNLSVVGVVRGRSPLAQEVSVCVKF